MLSALIYSQHSYPAMLLAEQLVHQRLVRSGPLVTFKPRITTCVDYILTLLSIGRVSACDKRIYLLSLLQLFKALDQSLRGQI